MVSSGLRTLYKFTSICLWYLSCLPPKEGQNPRSRFYALFPTPNLPRTFLEKPAAGSPSAKTAAGNVRTTCKTSKCTAYDTRTAASDTLDVLATLVDSHCKFTVWLRRKVLYLTAWQKSFGSSDRITST